MENASHGQITSEEKHSKPRRTVACNHCRAKKIRCNGGNPCSNCIDRAENCVVTSKRRQRAHDNSSHDTADLSRRVQQLETLIECSSRSSSSNHGPIVHSAQQSSTANQQSGSRTIVPVLPRRIVSSFGQAQDREQDCSDLTQINVDKQSLQQEESSVYVSETPDLEYYGPRCLVSFCSRPGVDWVVSKVKSINYRPVATQLLKDMARMLKMSGPLSTLRAPEPMPEIAWQYTQAYFEETPHEAFRIVDQTWFESHLHAYFKETLPYDGAHYALRNIIWATGSRIVLSKTRNFREASQISWAFFENALSVHTEILFVRASMVAVQALIVMAYYSEGLGKTSLQYMLCSNAMRLACSKGLHRQAASSWNLSQREVQTRNWMFWSIYCLEKHICSRSGRPSVMDDDEISCHVPQRTLSSMSGSAIYCHILIDLMRLSSTVKKRLSSAQALRMTPDELIETVCDLNKQLEHLKSNTQYEFDLDKQLGVDGLPEGITLRQAQSLQCHYVCLLLDINTPLAYPWSGICTYSKQDPAAFTQVAASWNIVAQASRLALLATRQICIDPSCPALIALYTPVYSFISLFVHILRDPSTTTTQTDLALLDIAVGYLSNIEFATECEMRFSFAREMCYYARLSVDQNNANSRPDDTLNDTHDSATVSQTLDSAHEDEFFGWLPAQNLEDWSIMLPFGGQILGEQVDLAPVYET